MICKRTKPNNYGTDWNKLQYGFDLSRPLYLKIINIPIKTNARLDQVIARVIASTSSNPSAKNSTIFFKSTPFEIVKLLF